MNARSRGSSVEDDAGYGVRAVRGLGTLVGGEQIGAASVAGGDYIEPVRGERGFQAGRDGEGDVFLEHVIAQHGTAVAGSVRGIEHDEVAVDRRQSSDNGWRRAGLALKLRAD